MELLQGLLQPTWSRAEKRRPGRPSTKGRLLNRGEVATVYLEWRFLSPRGKDLSPGISVTKEETLLGTLNAGICGAEDARRSEDEHRFYGGGASAGPKDS